MQVWIKEWEARTRAKATASLDFQEISRMGILHDLQRAHNVSQILRCRHTWFYSGYEILLGHKVQKHREINHEGRGFIFQRIETVAIKCAECKGQRTWKSNWGIEAHAIVSHTRIRRNCTRGSNRPCVCCKVGYFMVGKSLSIFGTKLSSHHDLWNKLATCLEFGDQAEIYP